MRHVHPEVLVSKLNGRSRLTLLTMISVLLGRGTFTDLPMRVRFGRELQQRHPMVGIATSEITLLSEYEGSA